MLLETIDLLRCTAAHEEIPLVAAIHVRDDREIISGTLGCPLCHAEYTIENGVAVFGRRPSVPGSGDRSSPLTDEEHAMRCAAMLDLAEPGGTAVLTGTWIRGAAVLAVMTGVSFLVVDPASAVGRGSGVAAIRGAALLPLAARSVRAIALDASTAGPEWVASAVHALKPGGRLIAPVAAPLVAGLIERARDDHVWIAEAEAAASAPVQLVKGRHR